MLRGLTCLEEVKIADETATKLGSRPVVSALSSLTRLAAITVSGVD